MKLFKKDWPFYSKVFTLALPIALQSFITVGVNMIDNVMVGKLGDDALSAVSQANSFISIYHILCMGLGMGASVLVSRYWGILQVDKDSKEASTALKQTISLMIRLTLLLASIFAIATIFFPRLIMTSYSNEEAIITYGISYLSYSVITYFFLGTALTTTIALRSVGQVRMPLYISIGAFFINILANYTFIFGNFGAPKLGVAGAALGTLIARIFEFTIILSYLFIFDKRIGFRIRHLFMSVKTLITEYVRISIPVLVSDGILALGNNSVAQVIGHLGGAFVAATAITNSTQQLSTVVIQGIAQAGAIVTGQTLGMRDKDKTMEQGYLFLGLGFALGTVSAIFILLMSGPIIGAFDVTSEASEIARRIMISLCIIIVFQATNSIMTKGVLRGGGDTKMLMLADNVFLWVFALPLGILAGYYFNLSPFFIYLALKSDQIFKTVWCYFRLRSGKWIKKISTGDNSSAE